MTNQKKKNAANDDNPKKPDLSSKRAERIAFHRDNMPRQYRRIYDIAMTGRSLRAAINSQCIECIGYIFKEVRLCVSPQCPLFPYRPQRGVSYGVSDVAQSEQESLKPTDESSGEA